MDPHDWHNMLVVTSDMITLALKDGTRLDIPLLEGGASIETVSVLLGHTSIRVTEKHYNPWVKTRQDALDKAVLEASKA